MKYIILITWKNGNQEVFPTLTGFLVKHHVAPINTINNYISRRNKPYICEECIIQKIKINRE
jgi:hypothetical protein